MLAILLLLINFTCAQLVLNHPRAREYHRSHSRDHHHNHLAKPMEHLENRPTNKHSSTNSSSQSYANNDKHDDLLRRLSSTMLLETLLRHPFPTNRLPFPPLLTAPYASTIPIDRPFNEPPIKNRSTATKRIKLNNVSHRKSDTNSGALDTSTTMSDSNSVAKIEDKNSTSNSSADSFSPSSLNYLVERLLSMKTFNDETQNQKRPSQRRKDFHVSLPTSNQPRRIRLKSKSPVLTLDMLIKDEYDSRVQPMMKSLIEQQRLSTPNRISEESFNNQTTPFNNHKFDESATTAFATTSEPNKSAGTTSLPTMLPSKPTVPTNAAESNEGPADDSTEDESEEDEEDGNSGDDNQTSAKGSRAPVRKVLHNVPPYQLGTNFIHVTPSPENVVVNKSERAATSSTNESVKFDSINEDTHRRALGHKNADSSTRGSLVFSDGGDEAERASKRRAGNKDPNEALSYAKRYTNSIKNDKLGDSFLLNQLFSTVNPLVDLSTKLQSPTNQRDSAEPPMGNPLIYKGYVGKDDYLISTTASDWSRPINHSRDINSPPIVYKYLTPSAMTTTTPSPPTEPPVIGYNYILNQPVTNAQSVPTMVIPTSDRPPYETTTRSPMFGLHKPPMRKLTPMYSQKTPSVGQRKLSSSSDRSSLAPQDKGQSIIIQDRNYSYQIPDSKSKPQVRPDNHTATSAESSKDSVERATNYQLPSESERPDTRNKSLTSSRLNNNVTESGAWSPTKVTMLQRNAVSRPYNKTRRPSTVADYVNQTNVLLVGGGGNDSGPPIMFPVVEEKSRPTNRNMTGNASDLIDDSQSDFINELGDRKAKDSAVEVSDGRFSHADPKFNPQRNKSKLPNSAVTRNRVHNSEQHRQVDGAEGDGHVEATLDGIGRPPQRAGDGGKRTKRPNNDIGNDDSSSESDNDGGLQDAGGKMKSSSALDRGKGSNSLNDGAMNFRNTTGSSQAKKVKPLVNHEPAGSEISSTGIEDETGGNFRGTNRNQTARFGHPARTTETILIDSDQADSGIVNSDQVGAAGPSNQGSAIVPQNSNFFSEATSERPILDRSSTSLLNDLVASAKANNRNTQQNFNTAAVDPYQRTSSNTVLSAVQQPLPNTTTPIFTPKMVTSSTTPISVVKEDEAASTSVSINSTKPPLTASKSTSDRLAFILIGGSCVLSVVCLVLAAMSMRCQDMCDDYQSLRNAESAALKLQKHRLKYTKKHQVSRSQGLNSVESGQSLIDDLNTDNGTSSLEAEINHARNLRLQQQQPQHSKSIQFHNSTAFKNNDHHHHHHRGVFTNLAFAKDSTHCGCENCTRQRWMCQDDIMVGSNSNNSNHKHFSWLHPYHYMQHHSRLRPPFGAGSSVGTFFPRRHDEQNFRPGGSIDAQILIDGQPSHSCSAIDHQRHVTRSKSILQRSKNLAQARQVSGADSRGMFNLECNNPEHNHNVCHHNHHHHKCHLNTSNNNIEASLSDSSEITFDEALHCENGHCHGPASRSADIQNNRLRLIQMAKLNDQLSSGLKRQQQQQTGGHLKKANLHHHNSHQHLHPHHHNQPTTSSDSSSPIQCTCSKIHQPLVSGNGRQQNAHRTSHKHLNKHEVRESLKQQARRDKSMLIWSTNRDRLI